MENYLIMGRIGEGAHGIVLKAKHTITGEIAALKKVPLKNVENGIPCTTIREIKALQQTSHENDLKPANLLISHSGHLKIADFGQARLFKKEGQTYSHQVATRWYRAPELLYGSLTYDEGVDLWAVGCIFGEMLNKFPLFRGENDIEQLCLVLRALGTPTEDIWPGMTKLPDYNKISFPDYQPKSWSELVPDGTDEARDLLSQFLVYSSADRIRAKEALVHSYIFMNPLPCCDCELPKPNNNKHGLLPNIPSSELHISDTMNHLVSDVEGLHLDDFKR